MFNCRSAIFALLLRYRSRLMPARSFAKARAQGEADRETWDRHMLEIRATLEGADASFYLSTE